MSTRSAGTAVCWHCWKRRGLAWGNRGSWLCVDCWREQQRENRRRVELEERRKGVGPCVRRASTTGRRFSSGTR